MNSKVTFWKFFGALCLSCAILVLGQQVVFAWTNPAANPPSGSGGVQLSSGNVTVNGQILKINKTGSTEFVMNNGTTEWELYQPSSSTDLRLYRGGDLVTFQSGGNVGIGTIAPYQKFHIQVNAVGNTTTADEQLIIERNGHTGINLIASSGNNDHILFSSGATRALGSISYETGTQLMNFYNGGSARLSIITGGNVGVGTTTPGSKLTIGGTAGVDGIRFPDGTIQTTAGGSGSAVGWAASGNDIYNSNSGKVGVGTTTPDALLHTTIKLPSAAKGSVAAGNTPALLAVQGRYVYVANSGSNTLQIFDVSNPTAPVSVGSVNTGASPGKPFVLGRYVYLGNNTGQTFQVFDVSNPSSPVSVGSVSAGDRVQNVYVQGQYAYATNNNSPSKVFVFDVSNPSAPVKINTLTPSSTFSYDIFVQGKYLYVLGSHLSAKMDIYDISNPSVPTLVSAPTVVNYSYGLYVQGRYAYVISAVNNTFSIYDIKNPASVPAAVGSLTVGGNSQQIYVQGRYAYIANNTGNTIQVVDVSNPAAPWSVGTIPVTTPFGVFVQGRYLYTTNAVTSGNMLVFDLGGEYTQQLEAGGIETGTLATRNSLAVGGDADIKGGLTIGTGGLMAQGNSAFIGNNFSFKSADGAPAVWKSAGTLSGSRNYQCSVTLNGYVYNMGFSSASVEYAKINSDGTIGSWTTAANAMPATRWLGGCTTANGYIYYIGGSSGGNGNTNVWYTKVNKDGSTNAWQVGTVLPGGSSYNYATSGNGYIYVHQGLNESGSRTTNLYYAALSSDGSVGTWSTSTVPAALARSSLSIYNGYLYQIGGNTPTMSAAVYYSKIGALGVPGSWSTNSPALPAGRIYHTAIAANGFMYVIGGDGASTTYYGKIASNGSIAAWSTNTLPGSIGYHSSIYSNGYIYIIGGGSTPTAIYYSSLPRVTVGAHLDLLGSSAGLLSDSNDWGTNGGSITAGNIFSNGNLEVTGGAKIWNGLSVEGGLTVNGVSTAMSNDVWGVVETKNVNGTSVTFTGLNPDVDYMVEYQFRKTTLGNFYVRFNGDTGANYAWAADCMNSVAQNNTGGSGVAYGYLQEVNNGITDGKAATGSFSFRTDPSSATTVSGHGELGTGVSTSLASICNSGIRYTGSASLSSVTFEVSAGTMTGYFKLLKLGPILVPATSFSCPANFTKITNAGQTLGCMQNDEEGSAACRTAVDDCFDTYGGRLPSYNESYASFANFNLTNETDDMEWTDGANYDDAIGRTCGLIDGTASFEPTVQLNTATIAYRCWVPFNGGSGGLASNSIKGWAKFNGTAATVYGSYNVSSVTRNGTGDYTVTWSTPFTSDAYAVAGACQRTDTVASIIFQLGRGITSEPLTTTTARVGCGNYDGNAIDSTRVTVIATGN